MSRPLPTLGAVLAGGQSRRMGSPKEGVRLSDGNPMIEPVLRALDACCPGIVVVGACSGYDLSAWPNILHLRDLRQGLGPLSGIETLLASGAAEGYVVAACDQPRLTAPLLSALAGGARGRFYEGTSSARIHPLPGYYPASWLPAVRAAIDAGRLSLARLIDSQAFDRIPLSASEERSLLGLNTPQEVEALRGGSA